MARLPWHSRRVPFPSAKLLAQLGVKPSARYARFLHDREWTAVDGKKLDLPAYAAPIAVWFTREPDHDDAPIGSDGWIPLASLGKEEPTFLAVRASEDACPVGLWERGATSFMPVAASLDELFADFAGTRKPSPIDVLIEAANHVDRLLDGRRTKAKLKELEGVAARLGPLVEPGTIPSQAAMGSHPHSRVPSRALYMQIRALETLGRLRDACGLIERAEIDGEKLDFAETHARILLALGEDGTVVQLVKARGAEANSIERGMGARALVRQGNVAGAIAAYRELVAGQVEATLELWPKKTRGDETKKRIAAVRETLEADEKTRARADEVMKGLERS
jgi:hypothetical protein